MKKTGFRNVLSKKALSAVTVLAISGLIPTSFAIAGELEIKAELVASSTDVSVEQGASKSFKLSVKSDGNMTDAYVTVPTRFVISASGTFTQENLTKVHLYAKDMEVKVDAEVQVDPNLQPGNYTFTFKKNEVKIENTNQTGAKLDNEKDDLITFVVTKKQVTDTTAPVVTATPDRPANAKGWYNEDVTVTFTAADEEGGSDLDESSVSAPVTVSEDGRHTVTGYARDKAENEGSKSITINLDKTAPTISGSADREANEHGWYNDDVTVSFSASDETSGVADYTKEVLLSEGVNRSAEGTAIDNAGNSSSAIVSGINIDKRKPVITVEDGGTYTLNQVVTWSATDTLSGLADEDKTGTIDTSKVGPQTDTITVTDKAGNTTEVTISYTVVYNFGGVLQPIKDGSIFKAGSTVPVKFQLTDAQGKFISTANATIHYAKSSNQVFGDNLEAVSTSAATSGNNFRYDSSSNQYVFNLSTKGLTAGTYQLTITLDDGTKQKVVIGLK